MKERPKSIREEAAQAAYARGYAAAARRVEHLKREIAWLKERPPAPAGKAESIEYLLSMAETLTQAAALLIPAPAPSRDSHTKGPLLDGGGSITGADSGSTRVAPFGGADPEREASLPNADDEPCPEKTNNLKT